MVLAFLIFQVQNSDSPLDRYAEMRRSSPAWNVEFSVDINEEKNVAKGKFYFDNDLTQEWEVTEGLSRYWFRQEGESAVLVSDRTREYQEESGLTSLIAPEPITHLIGVGYPGYLTRDDLGMRGLKWSRAGEEDGLTLYTAEDSEGSEVTIGFAADGTLRRISNSILVEMDYYDRTINFTMTPAQPKAAATTPPFGYNPFQLPGPMEPVNTYTTFKDWTLKGRGWRQMSGGRPVVLQVTTQDFGSPDLSPLFAEEGWNTLTVSPSDIPANIGIDVVPTWILVRPSGTVWSLWKGYAAGEDGKIPRAFRSRVAGED